MMTSRKWTALSLAFLMLLTVSICDHRQVLGADWSGCASDLDDVHSASDDASDAAQAADEAQEDLDSKRSDLQSCSDDCDNERSDYEDAKSELADKVDELKSDLSTVDLRVREASDSCKYELGGSAPIASPHKSAPRPESKSSGSCATYQRYKGRLPLATIIKVCSSSMSESECRKCLSVDK
jgi:hypothetical protein